MPLRPTARTAGWPPRQAKPPEGGGGGPGGDVGDVLERVGDDAAGGGLAVAVLVEGEQAVDAPPVRLAPRRLVAAQRLQQRAVAQHLRLGELPQRLPVRVLVVRVAVALPQPPLPARAFSLRRQTARGHEKRRK